MEIKCTPQELKELLEDKTPIAGTTDVLTEKQLKCIDKYFADKF